MDSDHEDIINRLRQMVALLVPKAKALQDQGVDVADFLTDAENFIAAIEGRYDGEYDVNGFVGRLGAFAKELQERDHLIKQAEKVRLVAQLPRTPELLDEMAEHFRGSGSERAKRMVAEIEATADAVRARLAEGIIPVEEMEDLTLSLSAEFAEVNRRVLYRSVALARFFETRSAEWWAERTDAERAQTENLMEDWRNQREDLLGQLPLEDRQRLESATAEDFDTKPELWKP